MNYLKHRFLFIVGRVINGAFAMATGKFWIQCRVCSELHGGHERMGWVRAEPGPGEMEYHAICKNCAIERQRIAEDALVKGHFPIEYRITRRPWRRKDVVHRIPFHEFDDPQAEWAPHDDELMRSPQ